MTNSSPAAGSLRDPVCHMPVQDTPSTPFAYYKNTKYLFCSDYCKRAFERNPEAYLAPAPDTIRPEKASACRIAYFSMEIAIDPRMPTYSGGLGVLAGDTLKSCADLQVPIVGITLLHRKGYFFQSIDANEEQKEEPEAWLPESRLKLLPAAVNVPLEGQPVQVRAWEYDIASAKGFTVPVLFLDTDDPRNAESYRRITDHLYGGDQRYRLLQEAVLGIGGVRLLDALGFTGIRKFHLNEGHAALAALELLRRQDRQHPLDFNLVQDRCVFTTHTPVPAGHDQFDYKLVHGVLGEFVPDNLLKMLAGQDRMNMTKLALDLSRRVNGVARKHREVSEGMFPGYRIGSITNGVHSATWTTESFQTLYDRYIPGWRDHPAMLRQAIGIPDELILQAHLEAKASLVEEVKRRSGRPLALDALTIGFARRATRYKRPELVFSDLARLRELRKTGSFQFIFAGKAHPQDLEGKAIIHRILDFSRELGEEIPVIFLPNYEMDLARFLVSGVDLWLNTPQRPLEASGTSGMKAAHNGIPSLSVLDGWWVEGHIEGITGWSIGPEPLGAAPYPTENDQDAMDLYQKLKLILRLFHHEPQHWISIMKSTIALNASYFNTHRMVHQYVVSSYSS